MNGVHTSPYPRTAVAAASIVNKRHSQSLKKPSTRNFFNPNKKAS